MRKPVWTYLMIAGAALLLSGAPPAFSMGFGNNAPVITSVTSNPNPAWPAGQCEFTCIASDSDGTVTKYEWSADGGTFPNGTATQALDAPANTITWTAPLQTGNYNVTITVYDNGSAYGGPPATATSYMTVRVDGTNSSPVITSLVAEADSVFVGATIFIIASATDADGDPLTYQWSASGGTISGDADTDPEAITWTAPQTGGNYEVTVVVSDGKGGESSKTVTINVTVAREEGFVRTPVANPVRVTSDATGRIYVSDTHKNRILVYDQTGDPVGEIADLASPLGIVAVGGNLYVGEEGKNQVSIYSASGAYLGAFDGPSVQMPNSIAFDSTVGEVFVADSKARRINVYSDGGTYLSSIDGSSAVSGGFVFPVGVAVDQSSQTLYVSDAGTYQIHSFDYFGNHKISFGSMGKGDGQFTRPQGLAVDANSRIFAVDAYQSCVQVFDPNGGFVARVGTFGEKKGELKIPLDVHVDVLNRLLVTSNDNCRVEVYGLDENVLPLPNTPPSEPLLYLPDAGAEVASLTPELVVKPATDQEMDILTYDFQVFAQDQFEPVASVTGVPEAPDQIRWTAQPPLLENTFYEWRARAFDGVAAGPWTSTRLFYVNAVNEPPAEPPAILVEDGAELRPSGVLAWQASTDPDALDTLTYTVEIDDNADFSSVLLHQENIRTTEITLASLIDYDLLADDTLYYWRVQAVDNHGGSSTWAAGSFYFNRIEIEVSSSPSGARVYIDGSPAYPGWRAEAAGSSLTPLIVTDVEEALHIVTVLKDGYASYSAIADNRMGADANIFADLAPASPVVLGSPIAIESTQVIPGNPISLSRPFLIDWNYDGKLDMLISDDSGKVHLLLGTPLPVYAGVVFDATAALGYDVKDASVFAVDWDNDSDFDLILGNRDGTILLVRNEGSQEAPQFLTAETIQADGQPFALASDTAPTVVDWNNDGKKDLLVGCSTGKVALLVNVGADDAPDFAFQGFLVSSSTELIVPTGHSVPFVMDWNSDGLPDLLVGGADGQIYLYLNVGTSDQPTLQDGGVVNFRFNKKKYLTANPGPYATPYLVDIDGDGLRDLLCGNEWGDLVLFPGVF